MHSGRDTSYRPIVQKWIFDLGTPASPIPTHQSGVCGYGRVCIWQPHPISWASSIALSPPAPGSRKMDNPATNFLIPEKRLPYPCESREAVASYARTSPLVSIHIWWTSTFSSII